MLTRKISADTELRLLERHHADAVFAAVDAHRESLREWLPWVEPTKSPADTMAFIEKTLLEFAAGEGIVLGIWCEGQFAGTVGTHRFDAPNRKAEIGYWLAPEWHGRGLMTAACRALLEYLFEERGMERVEIRVAQGNEPSMAVARRLGARQEGVLRNAQLRHGEWDNLVVFSVLRGEWAPSAQNV